MPVTYINKSTEASNSYYSILYPSEILGMAFTTSSASSTDRIAVYLRRPSSLPSNTNARVYAEIFAVTGSVGTNARPTGSVLASGSVLVSSLTTSFALTTINFTQRAALSSSTGYAIVIRSDANSNYVEIDRMSNYTGTNWFNYSSGNWSTNSYDGFRLSVYGAPNNRYSVASGNWSSNSTWSDTTSGSAGVSPPVTGDTVFIANAASVTLTSNEQCLSLLHTSGTLNIAQYTLDISTLYQTYFVAGACVLNTGTGTVNINTSQSSQQYTIINASQFTTSGSGVIRIYAPTGTNHVQLADINYGNVIVVLGASSNSTTTNFTGNPTFNSFVVKSQNSAPHTISFSGNITAKKAVFIGSSATNRLTIGSTRQPLPDIYYSTLTLSNPGTVYAQNVSVIANSGAQNSLVPVGVGPFYLGSNSVQVASNYAGNMWLTEEPPKISSLVDPLTSSIGSNSNFYAVQDASGITSVTSGFNSGGYRLQSTASLNPVIATKGTYDLTDVWFSLHVNYVDGYYLGQQVFIDTMPVQLIDGSNKLTSGMAAAYVDDQSSSWNMIDYSGFGRYVHTEYYAGNPLFKYGRVVAIKINSSGLVEMKIKPTPSDPWGELVTGLTLTQEELLTFKSSRIFVGPVGASIFGSSYPAEDFLMFNAVPVSQENSGAFFAFFYP